MSMTAVQEHENVRKQECESILETKTVERGLRGFQSLLTIALCDDIMQKQLCVFNTCVQSERKSFEKVQGCDML